MVIVDTTVWVDYLRGIRNPETQWLDRELPFRRFGLTDLILCEALQGVKEGAHFATIRDELLNFRVFEPAGIELAIAAAQNYQILRRHGFTVRKIVDCLIGTLCLRERYSLLHRDRDFDPFEEVLGLAVIHP